MYKKITSIITIITLIMAPSTVMAPSLICGIPLATPLPDHQGPAPLAQPLTPPTFTISLELP